MWEKKMFTSFVGFFIGTNNKKPKTSNKKTKDY